MTFEEFFNKKRIDLELMRNADPALYSEFKSHFESMGEKSFDHTKKFWFNKLRHLYHLAEPAKKAVTQLETKIASQAESLSSPTIEQQVPEVQPASEQEVKAPAAAKPAFRPRNIPAAASGIANKPDPAPADAPEEKPVVSKPGFKPRNIKPVSGELSEDAKTTSSRPGQDIPSGNSQGNTANLPRSTYKPRFNAGKISGNAEETKEAGQPAVENTQPASQTGSIGESQAIPTEATETSKAPEGAGTPEQPKPAYKPRFNLKNLPSKANTPEAEQSEEGSSSTPPPENAAAGSSGTTADASTTSEPEDTAPEEANAGNPSHKPAYKPRFNVKTTVSKTTEEAPTAPADENPAEAGSSPDSVASTDSSEDAAAKPAYKPRFNIKNIKPKE